jgi:hypothetical protein
MPDTFGKRQRDAAKARRREVKDERRAARKAERDDPSPPLSDVPPGDPEAGDPEARDHADQSDDIANPGPP